MSFLKMFKNNKNGGFQQLSDMELGFLINYLCGRSITWHIDDKVLSRYPDINNNIDYLIRNNFLQINDRKYILTQKGEDVKNNFRSTEKIRKKTADANIITASLSGDFLSAYNIRAKYERDSVLPHGLFVFTDSKEHLWAEAQTIPFNVRNYINNSQKLDFRDIQNSEPFKETLRSFYIGHQISGSNSVELPLDFEEKLGEHLICPKLDIQLLQKCKFPNPPKLRIYYRTKVKTLNYLLTGLIQEWDGQYWLGMYDCTTPLNSAMAEFEVLRSKNIDTFPKTFKTYYKHKKANSDKYKNWAAQYNKLN